MAQPSVYFSAGRLTMLQRNVLDAAGMERLLSTASLPEARKTLSELGWTGADITDPEQLAADRVNQAAQDARALSPEPALVDCFLYAYDAANLKMLLKARLLGLRHDSGGCAPPRRHRPSLQHAACRFPGCDEPSGAEYRHRH